MTTPEHQRPRRFIQYRVWAAGDMASVSIDGFA